MYQLEKYHGKATRHECPKCHDRHSFTYYVDEDGQPLDPICGRCDRETKCGYHYTPKQYFQDHPTDKTMTRNFVPKKQAVTIPKPLCTMPQGIVTQYASYDSTLVRHLRKLFPRQKMIVPRLGSLYALGATKDKDIIFWQIDTQGRVRTGKIMKYGEDGHRVKDDYGVNWVHARLKKEGELPKDWKQTQCLFGEHLLNLSINKDKVVALVESEKTALIGAACRPDMVWLATGGKSQLSIDKMKVLEGRTVIMFPDVDGFKEWNEAAKGFTFCKVIVSDILEKNATDEERAAQIDIADKLIKQLRDGFPPQEPIEEYNWLFYRWLQKKQKSNLELMIEEHPDVQHLINELGLVPDD